MKKIIYKHLIVVINIFVFGVVFAQVNEENKSNVYDEDQCITCHQELELMPEGYSEIDIHMQTELSCAGCHGGDPTSDDQEIAMSPSKGFIGIPAPKDIPQFCGKCHSNIEFMRTFQPRIATDQVSQYYTSVHGKKLKEGDINVAECTSCHTSHSILPASNPRSSVYSLNVPQTCRKCHSNAIYMKGYSIPTNQFELYSQSVHGNALLNKHDVGAPACNDCHGNHGAAPPGVASVSHVCGTCHLHNLEYFTQTRMAHAFEEMDFHGCEQCHGYHSVQKANDDFVGVSSTSFCINCHEKDDSGFETAKSLHNNLRDLINFYDSANTKLREVQIKGMNDIDIGYVLQDAKQNLIQSRTLIHTFDPDRVSEKTKAGIQISEKAIELADQEINNYYSRRIGFAGATIVLVILAIALFFKIKDIENEKLDNGQVTSSNNDK